MKLTTALATLLLAYLAALQEHETDAFLSAYQEAADARQSSALLELWQAKPTRVLGTIDSDLERSLALFESNPEQPDLEGIAKLEQRALFGAKLAAEVLDRPLLLDYASAFVGWTPAQQQNFRAGQAAFGKARQALSSDNLAEALLQARSCSEFALPLGDWWGAAMGLTAEAEVLSKQGEHEKALECAAKARLIHHGLFLVPQELSNLSLMAASARSLDQPERALAALESALSLNATMEQPKGLEELHKQRAELLELLGRAESPAPVNAAR